MNHINNHERIVASRDRENGCYRVRIDYIADGDVLNFYIDGDKMFAISKKILHKSNSGITYTIVIENKSITNIDMPIVLYSDNNGIFTTHKVFQRDIVGKEFTINSIKPGQKIRSMFLIKQIIDKEEALCLIRELTEETIYGKKILSIFERLSDELRNDKELFMEGLQHNLYVMFYASEELQKDPELLSAFAAKYKNLK